MTNKMAVNQRAQYLDVDGNPLSMGRVTFREVDSDVNKSIFADPSLSVELSNPVLLDAGGFVPESSIYYGEGNYSVLVEHVINPGEAIPEYAEEYLVPIVVGSDSTVPTGNVVNISSVEELTNFDIGSNSFVRCSQYYNRDSLDQGGGLFKWYPSSSASADLGMIIASTVNTAGKFFRIGDGESIKTAWYGVADDTGTSMNNRLGQADAYCSNDLKPILEITEAVIGIVGTININSPVKINAGVRFTQFDNVTGTKINFTSDYIDVISKSRPLVTDVSASLSVVFLNKHMDIYPAWLGADGGGIADDYTPFYNLRESVGHIVIDKAFNLTAAGSPSSNLILNKVRLINGGYIINDIDSLTIISCSGEEDAHNVFRGTSGDFSNYVFKFVGYAKWFFDLTCSDVQLSTLRTALIRKHLIWDRYDSYTLSPLVDCQEPFVNEVKFGTKLKSDSKVNFGQIVAGSYQVFTLDTIVPGYVGPKVDGAWFGAHRFADFADNATGIKNAILASDEGVVDFGGVKLQADNMITISTAGEYTIKNLHLVKDFATLPAINFFAADVTIHDSKIDSIETGGVCDVNIFNTEFFHNDVTQYSTLVSTSLRVEGCTFKSVTGDWTGELNISGTARTIFDNNIVEGGELEFYCGGSSKLNSLSGNAFDKNKRIGTDATEQSYLVVVGGDNLTCNNNTFSAENNASSIGDFNQLEFRGYNGTDIVESLVCVGNVFNAEMNSVTPIRATNYADTGHNARVHDNTSNALQNIPRATRHKLRSATVNDEEITETEDSWIFPNQVITSYPYFSGTSWAPGDGSASGLNIIPNVFGGEILTYTPSGGECSIEYMIRAYEYEALNYMAITISVEKML